jgi:hypothetical protein
MTSPYLTPPAAQYIIPVTLGAGTAFTLQRVDGSGNPLNYDVGTTVTMALDIPTAPTTQPATVSGSSAAFQISNTVLDLVKTGTRWRVVMNADGLEIPLIVGRFERHDG